MAKPLFSRFFVAGVIAALILTTGISSCKKDTTAKVIITVVNSANAPVVGIPVELYCVQQGCTVIEQQNTLSDGKAIFEFELTSILYLRVNGVDQNIPIRLIAGETVEETVTL